MNTTTWKIDAAHSEIAFKVKHMMISTVTGYFEDFSATIESASNDFKDAQINFSASIDSINTKNKDRDAHLKSNDFFNAEQFPTMTFVSKSFDGENLIGDLSIRDVTKEVHLKVDINGVAIDPYGQTKAGFEIKGELNRKDYNLTWSAITEAGSIVVADTVKIVIDAQFIQQG